MGVCANHVCSVYFANYLGAFDRIAVWLVANAKWLFFILRRNFQRDYARCLLGRYIKRVGDANAVMFGLTSSCLSLSLYGLVTQGWMMYVLILCNVLAFATGPALQAMFSRAVDARSQGTAMGSLTALASIMSVCATLAGTSLLGQVSHQAKGSILLGAPFFMAAVVQAIALVLATRYLSKSKVVSP